MARRPAKRQTLEVQLESLLARYGNNRLAPPLEGLADRFTIWLPVQCRGKVVFSEEQRIAIGGFLNRCFGGYSQSNLQAYPPWVGSWLPNTADEAVIDQHIHLIVYALQDSEAVDCMRRLKWLLEQGHIAAQEVVLIEQVPIQFVESLSAE